MKIRTAAIIFTVAFLLQGTLLNLFSVFGWTPNLILCLVIAFTFLYENENAIYLALIFGIISDICFSNLVGVSSLGYLLVGLGTFKCRSLFNKENLISSIIITSIGTVVYNIFCWGLSGMFIKQLDFLYILELQIVYVLYNLLVVVLIYFAVINRVVRHRNDRYYT